MATPPRIRTASREWPGSEDAVDRLTPWLLLAGLGAFHGLNPAMGWLFAVALGIHRGRVAALLLALPALLLGHMTAVGVTVALFLLSGAILEPRGLASIAGALLLLWAGLHWRYGHRHRLRVGLTSGLLGLYGWSAGMAAAHGAGLMVLPVLLPLCLAPGAAALPTGGFGVALAAVGVHMAAMAVVTTAVALAVYGWLGVAVLRRGWINLDLLWVVALALSGLWLLFG